MWKKVVLGVLIVLVLIVVVFVVLVVMQPEDMRIQRQKNIAASPEAVFEQVNSFKNWQAWSPWEKLDPKMDRTFEGPESGKGAIYKWKGNDEVGEGRMTILESKPGELVQIKLDFLKPMETTSTTEFTFKPKENETLVTWTMTGKNNFMFKAMHLVMDMDKMIGADFEKGLTNLKTVLETKK